jgi:hypothetical protein
VNDQSPRFLAWPNYDCAEEVVSLLLLVKPLLQQRALSLFLHDDSPEGDGQVPALVASACREAALGDATSSMVVGNAHSQAMSSFAAYVALASSADGKRRELRDDAALPIVSNRYEAEEVCIAAGTIMPDVDRAFCPKPWWHLYLDPKGVASPCCVAPLGESLSVRDHPLPSVFNNEGMKKVRLKMLRGLRVAACKDCWQWEERGELSYRQMHLKNLADSRAVGDTFSGIVASAGAITRDDGSIPDDKIAPLTTDIRWSNVCDFKCRMCGHGGSSSWFQDARSIADTMELSRGQHGLGMEKGAGRRLLLVGNKAIVALDKDGDVVKSILPYLGAVRVVYSAGGEPLMMSEHYTYLEHLLPRAAEIALTYNTNLSTLDFKGRDLLSVWAPFQQVLLGVSVDGMGPVGEYVRTGFNTERFFTNLRRIREAAERHDKITYWLAITVSNFNIFHVPEFVRSLLAERFVNNPDDIYMHVVRDPAYASPSILPRGLRTEAAALYRGLIEELSRNYPHHTRGRTFLENVANYIDVAEEGLFELHRDNAWFWLTHLDRLRGTSWQEVVPHMGCFEPGYGRA